jgi:hypothetical protein
MVVTLVIEPVQDFKKTIGQVSHALIEHTNVYLNPGIAKEEIQHDVSSLFRKLSSQLHAHLFLVPLYSLTAVIFGLPSREKVLAASSGLIGLSNSVFRDEGDVSRHNEQRRASICGSLGIYIYMPEGNRLPKDAK